MTVSKEKRLGNILASLLHDYLATWGFIFWLSFFMVSWIVWNTYAPTRLQFDPYPYILFNLILSALAAFTAPILMIAEKVKAPKKRIRSK